MRQTIENTLRQLRESSNFRVIPDNAPENIIDLSSNDYLGINARPEFQEEFLNSGRFSKIPLGSVASRLLASDQNQYALFEADLEKAYHRPALLFNSGYHANTGIISAIASKDTVIVADKLVHASIIDGIKLSGAPFERFRHNDYAHAARLASKAAAAGKTVLLIAESVYSMDGDCADIEALVKIKKETGNAVLYIDEAHAVGVLGQSGLGLCYDNPDVDIVIGTLGKALASSGAYAICDEYIKDFLINRARSLIFSTALSPFQVAWSRFTFAKALDMDAERSNLQILGKHLKSILGNSHAGHIQPLVVGSPDKALAASALLRERGFNVLPIRVPTVPPGTDRLRFSLSATLKPHHLNSLEPVINSLIK